MTVPFGLTREEYQSALAKRGEANGAPAKYLNNAEIIAFTQRLGPNYDWNGLAQTLSGPSASMLSPQDYDAMRGVYDEHNFQEEHGQTDFRGNLMARVRLAPGSLEPYYRGVVERGRTEVGDSLRAIQNDMSMSPEQRINALEQRLQLRSDVLNDRATQINEYIGSQYLHDVSAGLYKIPDRILQNGYAQEAQNSLIRPAIGLAAMYSQGKILMAGLGLLSKTPLAAQVLERLGPRVANAVQTNTAVRTGQQLVDVAREGKYILGDLLNTRQGAMATGIVVGGALDAARPEGIPEDPWAIDLSGSAAKWLHDKTGLNDRMALGVAGAAQGGLIGVVIGGVLKGLELGRFARTVAAATPDEISAMQRTLQEAGVATPVEATRFQIGKLFWDNARKVSMPVPLASMFAERSAREEWILSQVYGDKNIVPASEDARYVYALSSVNPGGVTVAKGIQDLEGVEAAARTINPNVQVVSIRRGSATVPGVLHLPPNEATAIAENLRTTGFGSQQAAESAPATLGNVDLAAMSPEALESLAIRTIGQQNFTEAVETNSKIRAAKGEQLGAAESSNVRAEVAKRVILENDGLQRNSANIAQSGPRTRVATTEHPLPPDLESTVSTYLGKPRNAAVPSTTAGPSITDPATVDRLADEFHPSAELLRERYGDTVTLFRHETGAVEGLVSKWTSNRATADAQLAAANEGRIVSRQIPVDDIVWYSNRGNTNEFIVRNEGTLAKVRPQTVNPRAKTIDVDVPHYDVLVVRNRIRFDEARNVPRPTTTRVRAVERLLASDKIPIDARTLVLTPEGKVLAGSPEIGEVVRKVGAPVIKVNGVDDPSVSFREGTGSILGRVNQEQGRFIFEIPNRITNEQASSLIHFTERNKPNSIQIINSAGKEVVLVQPTGAQIEDALGSLVRKATKEQVLTPELIAQYKKQGVFEGQAAIGSNGVPYRILRKTGALYEVENPLRPGSVVRVHPSKLQILPTTLDGTNLPNTAFANLLDADTRQALGKLYHGMDSDLARPVKTRADLERLGSSFGFSVSPAGRGKFELTPVTVPGEAVTVEGLDAAVEFIRTHAGPVPDLTPPELTQILGGNSNLGFVGINSAGSQFGERIPLDYDAIAKALENDVRGPGAFETRFKPTRALFLNMEEKTGIPFFKMFNEIQTNGVRRQNFLARWALGQGDKLPEGVLPLSKIVHGAKGIDPQAITEWLETPIAERGRVTAQLGKEGVAVAQQMRTWYDAMFKEFGITADYLEEYAPRIRQMSKLYGNDPAEAWRRSTGKTLPKGADFFADHIRTGMLDVYETDAFKAAQGYLKSGSSNRFMKATLDKSAEFLRALNGRRDLAMPMAEFIESLRGFEFLESKQQLEETFRTIFEHMTPSSQPGVAKQLATNIGETALGLGYASTMAYRPASALRNMFQLMQTAYPASDLSLGQFSEAVGQSLTQAGKLEAINAGAINLKPQALPFRDEISDAVPQLSKFIDAGFKMYDSADDFTRAASYHVFKMQANNAISEFAKGVAGSGDSKTLINTLLRDSGVFKLDAPLQQEFLRRLGNDPTGAAEYIGKEMTDYTQFLYGRGMQPKWMRSIFGKFLGQYGTWPLWFIDYQTRMISNLAKNGGMADVARFVGRQAVVNGAVLAAGSRMGLEMGKWLSYPAMFYSGGPGVQVIASSAQLMHGLSGQASGDYTPGATGDVTTGLQGLMQSANSFIPFRSAIRDISRFHDAVGDGSMQEALAAVMGTKPSRDVRMADLLDAVNHLPQYHGGEEWLRHVPSQYGQSDPLVVGGMNPMSGLKIPSSAQHGPGQGGYEYNRTSTRTRGPALAMPGTQIPPVGGIVAPPTIHGANQIPDGRPIEY